MRRLLRPDAKIAYLQEIAPKFSGETDILLVKVCNEPSDDFATSSGELEIANASAQMKMDSSSVGQSQHACHSQRWVYEKDTKQDGIWVSKWEVQNGEKLHALRERSIEVWKGNMTFTWNNPRAIFSDGFSAVPEYVPIERSEVVKQSFKRWFSLLRDARNERPPPVRPVATFQCVWGDKEFAALFRGTNLEGVRFRRVFTK